jgi:hypothetical protein
MKQLDERTFYWAAGLRAGSFWTIFVVEGADQERWSGFGGGAAWWTAHQALGAGSCALAGSYHTPDGFITYNPPGHPLYEFLSDTR